MPIETTIGSIKDLNPLWPLGTDRVHDGDDHVRNTKLAIQKTFPNIDKPINVTANKLNDIDTATTITTTDFTIKTNVNVGDSANAKGLHVFGTGQVDGLLLTKAGIQNTGTITSEHFRATGNSQLDGDVGMSSNLTIAGKATSGSVHTDSMQVTGQTTMNNKLTITGAGATINGGLTNNGNMTVSGTATFNGNFTANQRVVAPAGVDARFGYFNSSGDIGNGRQGCHVIWNERGQDAQWSGATSFVNNFGSGNGGFLFRNVNSNNSTQRGEWQMFTGGGNSDTAGFICQAPNGSRSTFRTGGGSHSFEWITGSGVAGDGKPYIQFGFDGGSKGVNFFDSDIKFKEDVRDVEKGSALATVDKLRSVSFHWKGAEDGLRSPYGVIAQEVKEVIPEMIQTHDDGTLAVDPLNMIGLLLAALKDLKAEVDSLKGE